MPDIDLTRNEAPTRSITVSTARMTLSKATGKALVADTSLVGEVLGPDVISDVAYTIDNLKQNQAHQLLVELREQQELNTFKIGGVLSMIQEQGWFAPYGSFKEYVEQEHLIRCRTALYWIKIYRALLESGVSWEKVKHLGWSKLKELAGVLTVENTAEWIDIAEKQTTLQLIETVKTSIAEDDGEAPGSAPTKEVVNRSFKLHTDQRETIEAAIAKARELSGTSVDTVALEYICLEFLGGKHRPSSTGRRPKRSAKAGLDDALAAFEVASGHETTDDALRLAVKGTLDRLWGLRQPAGLDQAACPRCGSKSDELQVTVRGRKMAQNRLRRIRHDRQRKDATT